MTHRIWTVGHSTRTADELAELIGANDIEILVDVRSYPGSRRHPHFNREQMERWVPEHGVEYRHMVDLGGRRKRQDVDPSLNGAWTHPSFRNYADYATTDEFETALDELADLARSERVAYMCSEALVWRCHRSLISTALVARGWDVTHIMCDRNREHVLGQWGPPPLVENGRVTYPLPQLSLV